METINVFEVLPEEDSKTIANLIWKLLDKAGIETTKDAELQIEVYDEEEDQTKPLTYSDSPFFSNWSQTYYTNLTLEQHIANNNWLMNTLTMLKDDGVLYVPNLNKTFNTLGEEL